MSTPIVNDRIGIVAIGFPSGGRITVDERDIVDQVAEQPEMDCLNFLKGRVKSVVLFLTAFLIDVALLEIDDWAYVVSTDLAIVKNSDDLLFLIQSNL